MSRNDTFQLGEIVHWRWSIGELLAMPTDLKIVKRAPAGASYDWQVQSINSGNIFYEKTEDIAYPVDWYVSACEKAGSGFCDAWEGTGGYYCLDCFFSCVLGSDKEKMYRFLVLLQQDRVMNMPDLLGTINENTVQYEQWPGQVIPLDGVVCAGCGEELYAPYDADPLDGRITQVERL